MTATFDASLTNTRDSIRLTVGDTDIDAPYLQDETYDALLVRYASDEVQATLACFDAILAQMATPDIYADWYREFNHEKAYASMLSRREAYALANGLGKIKGRAVGTYRGDSAMTGGLDE